MGEGSVPAWAGAQPRTGGDPEGPQVREDWASQPPGSLLTDQCCTSEARAFPTGSAPPASLGRAGLEVAVEGRTEDAGPVRGESACEAQPAEVRDWTLALERPRGPGEAEALAAAQPPPLAPPGPGLFWSGVWAPSQLACGCGSRGLGLRRCRLLPVSGCWHPHAEAKRLHERTAVSSRPWCSETRVCHMQACSPTSPPSWWALASASPGRCPLLLGSGCSGFPRLLGPPGPWARPLGASCVVCPQARAWRAGVCTLSGPRVPRPWAWVFLRATHVHDHLQAFPGEGWCSHLQGTPSRTPRRQQARVVPSPVHTVPSARGDTVQPAQRRGRRRHQARAEQSRRALW